ncbi:MAG: hypothetical protein ACI4HI_14720 [Lachnospiraceae bacterium]
MVMNQIYEARKNEATEEMIKEIGWKEHKESCEDIFKRTKSLVNVLRKQIVEKALANSYFWNRVTIEASNRADREYGKTFDRIVFSDEEFSYTVICNMSGSGARYLVFETGKAKPLKKCSTIAELGGFLREKFD